MNRYWKEVAQCASQCPSQYAFRSAIHQPYIYSPRSGRAGRVFAKKVVYPLQVKAAARSGVAHVLDHSYAHMLRHVPRHVAKVVTLHDLIPLREPEGLSAASVAGFRRRVGFLREADVIVSVSDHSKREAVELLGIDPAKIHVSPNGVRAPGPASPPLSPGVSPPYILSVGSTLRRKRLDLLPAILREVRRTLPGMKLIRVGNALPPSLAAQVRESAGNDALEERGIVDDAELGSLYANSHAFLLTSSHEGFGLPVLEAMAAGCPVVCAATTSLPEVGGDAVLYFDLGQPEEAAAKIVRLAEEPLLRQAMVAAGLERAGRFTWEKHFSGLMEAYELALSRH